MRLSPFLREAPGQPKRGQGLLWGVVRARPARWGAVPHVVWQGVGRRPTPGGAPPQRLLAEVGAGVGREVDTADVGAVQVGVELGG